MASAEQSMALKVMNKILGKQQAAAKQSGGGNKQKREEKREEKDSQKMAKSVAIQHH